MQYTLLSRFRGTLVGAALAEVLGSRQGESNSEHPLRSGRLDSPQFNCQDQPSQLNQVAWLYAESLIQVGDLDLEYLHRSGDHQHTNTKPTPLTPADTLVGIIPVSLFFHEDEARLRQKILQATEVGHTPLALQSGTLAVAYAIAQSLREKLDPPTLITRTIAYLPQPPDLMVRQLEQVQRLLEQRAGLDAALSQLLKLQPSDVPSVCPPIALAFYCFLSTLEDYRLTIIRAARTGHQSPLTAILAGALSGAYNSIAGIPPGYRLTLLQEGCSQVSQRRKTTETVLVKLADQLLATWSGAYEPTRAFDRTDLNSEPAVAAPGIVRPR